MAYAHRADSRQSGAGFQEDGQHFGRPLPQLGGGVLRDGVQADRIRWLPKLLRGLPEGVRDLGARGRPCGCGSLPCRQSYPPECGGSLADPATNPLDGLLPIWQRERAMQDHPLKAFRESQRPPLSQRALADMLDVSTAAVSRWEAGKRQPDADRLKVIQEKTGIAPKVLRPDLAELVSGGPG